jgi:hypothetical protein
MVAWDLSPVELARDRHGILVCLVFLFVDLKKIREKRRTGLDKF